MLIYLGATVVTVVGLFTLYFFYSSMVDHRWRSGWNEAPVHPALAEVRALEAQQLAGVEAVAKEFANKGRSAFPMVAPKPSNDLSALSGWIRSPSFRPVTAFPDMGPAAPERAAPGQATSASSAPAAGQADVHGRHPGH